MKPAKRLERIAEQINTLIEEAADLVKENCNEHGPITDFNLHCYKPVKEAVTKDYVFFGLKTHNYSFAEIIEVLQAKKKRKPTKKKRRRL